MSYDLASAIKDSLGVVGGGIALYTFWRSGKVKRAEWLSSLHAKFYESSNYKMIRRLIDYEEQPAFGNLQAAIALGGDKALEESLVDYLNFFEFIASLRVLGQLSTREICMVFEYYLLRLNDHEFIMAYTATNGFENLVKLISDLERRQAREAA